MSASEFSDLMSPAKIGELELRNRIIMTPMGSNLAQHDGHCGERIQRYYEARAKGGAGMITVGVGAIAWPAGSCNPNQVAISSDEFLPGLIALTDRVHQHGCKAAIQLQHAGKVAVCDIAAGRPMLVPSIPKTGEDDMMQALTEQEVSAFVKNFTADGAKIEYKVATQEDIQWLINTFAEAADRAKRAGFDGVELHAGHGYILSEFLSPHVNTRDDQYGGCLENRARLLVEVIKAVKHKVGKSFPVWCRLDAKEYRVEGGIQFEDAIRTAELAEAAGIDAIHVSAYGNPTCGIAFTEAPLVHQAGGYIDFAAGIKARVNVPVIAVGRIEPSVANTIIKQGKADFVAMGRKLLADPELPNKLAKNRARDIRPCIYCYTCVSQIFINKSVMCAVNAATGHETEFEITPVVQAKKVLVVGGGPAGMEAARVAALRGHQVTLCERSARLGGTVFFSSLVYAENGKLVEYLERQVRNLAIDIRLGVTVDFDFIEQSKPDAVIIATGAKRDAPAIDGANRKNVFSGDELRKLLTGEDPSIAKTKLSIAQRAMMSAGSVISVTDSADKMRELSKLWMPLGKRVVIIGGGLVGVELAEFLVERGRRVSVLEEGDKLGVELAVVRRWRVLHMLREEDVELIANASVHLIDDEGVHYRCGNESKVVGADSIILASGAKANNDLSAMLQSLDIPIWQVGDCSGVSYIEGAMHEGSRAGREV
jgi:2,4-dienoyl-CoA reductase-like NADH-dependent reductase (Old Yellow Enzyme family)/NADPH-dependent 2,4-dienoyl-CoA reductase/sulfur reductase-like enzyme